MAKRYIVKLSDEERERLSALVSKGKTAAKIILKARIMLKADQSEAGEGWSDERILRGTRYQHLHGVAGARQAGRGGARGGAHAQEA